MQPVGARRIFAAVVLTALAAIGMLALLNALGPDWGVYAPASCTTTRCFCELPRVGALIVQPSNSWSSFGYVVAGLLMILMATARDWSGAMPRAAGVVFGVSAIAVGLGSVLLHATLTLWGQFYDVLGMYLVVSFMLVSALARWRRIPDRAAIGLYLALSGGLVTVLIVAPEVRRWLFAVVLLLAIIVELGLARRKRAGVKTRYYLFGMLAMAVAFVIWNLDQHGIVCAPTSLMQGHAVWHLMGAWGMWLNFAYYRSERSQGA